MKRSAVQGSPAMSLKRARAAALVTGAAAAAAAAEAAPAAAVVVAGAAAVFLGKGTSKLMEAIVPAPLVSDATSVDMAFTMSYFGSTRSRLPVPVTVCSRL